MSAQSLALVAVLQPSEEPVRSALQDACRAPNQEVDGGVRGYLDRHGHCAADPFQVIRPWQVIRAELGALQKHLVQHSGDLGMRLGTDYSRCQRNQLLPISGVHHALLMKSALELCRTLARTVASPLATIRPTTDNHFRNPKIATGVEV